VSSNRRLEDQGRPCVRALQIGSKAFCPAPWLPFQDQSTLDSLPLHPPGFPSQDTLLCPFHILHSSDSSDNRPVCGCWLWCLKPRNPPPPSHGSGYDIQSTIDCQPETSTARSSSWVSPVALFGVLGCLGRASVGEGCWQGNQHQQPYSLRVESLILSSCTVVGGR
jgi:hypothetical protein